MIGPILVLGSLVAVASSASEARRPPPDTYTRAALADLGTAELAQRLLGPEAAAAALSHIVEPPSRPGQHLTVIRFALSPRPIGDDICGKDQASVNFAPIGKRRAPKPPDAPVRIVERGLWTRIALAPGCRTATGQHFAMPIVGMPLEKSIEVLRSLNAARAAAAAPGTLPYRLSCLDSRSRKGDMCGTDPRATLASLPLGQAFHVNRSRNVEGAFSVMIGDPAGYEEDVPFWEIQLIAIGTEQAEIRMYWNVRTLI
jgi:hypothetical protein